MKSSFTIPRINPSSVLEASLGYQQSVPVDEQKGPDLTAALEDKAIEEHKSYRRKSKKNIFSSSRDNIDEQQQEDQPLLQDEEIITTSFVPIIDPVVEEVKADVIPPSYDALNGQIPVPLHELEAQAQPLPPWADDNNILEGADEERQQERPMVQDFIQRLRFFGGPTFNTTVSAVKKLFIDYKAMVRDRKDEAELKTIRERTKDLTDDEFEDFIGNNNIHRQCYWDVFYDEEGRQHAKIICDFDGRRKKTFLVR